MAMPKGARLCLSAVLVVLVGCASAPPPKPAEALSRADYAIAQARRAVGDGVQSVPLYEAEQNMETARRLVSSEDRTAADVARAERLAERAVLDAQLAQSRAERRDAESRVAELEEALAELREQIEKAEGGAR
ncbi:DUF4398 domain-containing protein [Ectothiorhodospiraceae bacterium WFHF3C12]|nr:DUF4398 domain-containing protein [Ectothiorhodospiraceae bacterium WFHF3C12]